MPETIEQRVGKLEVDFARIQEQYSQIIKTLAEISGQLASFNLTFVRRDLCEQAHKSYDREQYEFRRTIEKKIVESGERLQEDINAMAKDTREKFNRMYARFWWIAGICATPVLGHLILRLIEVSK